MIDNGLAPHTYVIRRVVLQDWLMGLTFHACEANEVHQPNRTEWFGETIRRFWRRGDIADINATLSQHASLHNGACH